MGNPWNSGPYGYCCSDGKRAFLALHNACWKDSLVPLELGSAWGLSDGQAWDLYRWYPDPARLQGEAAAFGAKASIALRPFEIVLLEIVPHGQSPSLNRDFPSQPIPLGFAEASRPIKISVTKNTPSPIAAPKPAGPRSVVVKGQVPASPHGGMLVVYAQMRTAGKLVAFPGPGKLLSGQGKLAGKTVAWQPALGKETYPSSWQTWRTIVERSAEPRPFQLEITTSLTNVDLSCKSYFLPP